MAYKAQIYITYIFFIENSHYSGFLIQVLQGSELFKLYVEKHHKMVGIKSMGLPGLV
jgi:hypothetical protein